MTRRTYFGLLATGAAPLAYAANDAADLTRFGIKADGKTDDTAAIQKAMDAAATMGETVRLPAGKYLVAGSLRIPPGVSLEGVHDAQQWAEPLTGTVILATAGRDKEDGPCAVRDEHFHHGAGPDGLLPRAEGHRHQALSVDVPSARQRQHRRERHAGQQLQRHPHRPGEQRPAPDPQRLRLRAAPRHLHRRCTDIGRIENVQFHGHWWWARRRAATRSTVKQLHVAELEAFIFGRTDWEYVTNTFVFPAKIGYRFIRTAGRRVQRPVLRHRRG